MSDKTVRGAESRRSFLRILGAGAAALGTGRVIPGQLFNKQNFPMTQSADQNLVLESNPYREKSEKIGRYGFEYFVGIVGSPADPDISWSDHELRKIKDLGVNMVQLSIAWGGRPANEVLNLEDLDADQIKKWQFRVKQAQKFGFATIAQFGIPRILYTANAYSIVQPACILGPDVREKYSRLLGGFLDTFPTVDNVLIYTYDQNAWLCSEFGPCPRCSGIPLSERLVEFLNFLNDVFQKHRPGGRMWWKPWEISNGEAIEIAKNVGASHFGLVLNPSSANEVYAFNDRAFKSDLGIKRIVQIAADRGIPVIGEIDYTFYKGYDALSDYFPRLVHEQLQGWKELKGVIGVKEYFGFAPSQFSVNAAMLKASMESPHSSVNELLERIAEPYGTKASPHMIQAWEYVARGMEAYPWDVTPSFMGLGKGESGAHSWKPATIFDDTWATPAWKTNRPAYFMLSTENKAHPWLFEDVGLQMEDSADFFDEAIECLDEAIGLGSSEVDNMRMQRESIAKIARSIRGVSLHFLETLAAQDARLLAGDPEQWRKVINRLDSLLEMDVKNQGQGSDAVRKLEDFQNDPMKWLNENLSPVAFESVCTIDWSEYVPYANRQ